MNITIIISVCCLVFCCFVFFYVKWYIKRRTSADIILAEYRSEVYRLIAEIDAATDRDSRLVEERIKSLKSLLDDTDKRIAVYMRELERSRSGEALYTSLGRGIRAALNTPPAEENKQPPESAAAAVPQQAPQTIQPSAEPEEPPSRQQIRIQVANLAAQGLAPAEIASRLDLSLSEVDLALNLLGYHSQE